MKWEGPAIAGAAVLVLSAVRMVRRRGRTAGIRPPAPRPVEDQARARSRSASPWPVGDRLDPMRIVAAREIRERLRGRLFRAGTAIILIAVAAAIVIPVVRGKSAARPLAVGVVGHLSSADRQVLDVVAGHVGTTVRFVAERSDASAEADVRSGSVTLAIVGVKGIVVKTPVSPATDPALAGFASVAATFLGAEKAAESAGLSAMQRRAVLGARPLPVRSLQPAATKAVNPAAIFGVIILFVMLTQYTTWILFGVMEEKANRVVEVLLATMRPMQLLAGKVAGIGLVALGQAALTVVFALGLAEAVGSDLLHGAGPVQLAGELVWLVLGYAFYCWVYAAAGSTVERQDQVQTLVLPLAIPMVFGYVMSVTVAASGRPSLFFEVLAYVPPTAPFAMSTLVGLGRATWWQFGASAAISVVATAGMARIAAVIYRRAILRTGRKVRLREVLADTPA